MTRAAGLPLRDLQRWFAAVVMHPASAARGLTTPAARAIADPRAVRAGALVAGDGLAPLDRLQIYQGAYLARLVEVLQGDFAALHALLGDAAFQRLAASFVAAHPSRHPNLNPLGRALPAFVARQRRLPARAFAAELATLERAVADAFDAPEFTALTAGALAEVSARRQGRLRLPLNPSVRLLAFRYPVDEVYQAWRDRDDEAGRTWAPPAPGASFVCVHRRADRVWRVRLPRGGYRVLRALGEGRPLAAALASAGRGVAPDVVAAWFQGWAGDGRFGAPRSG